MKTQAAIVVLATLLGCADGGPPAAGEAQTPAKTTLAPAAPEPSPPKLEALAPPKKDSEKSVVDIAVGSPDHTTLVAAVKAADLVEVLASPGGVYTVFAPTNAAFDKLPKGTVEGLLKPEKKPELRAIVQHHAAVPILQMKDMRDGESLSMSDGTKVTFHVKDGKVMVNDAHIVGSVPAMNGIVYVVDAVLLPPAK